MNKKLYCLLFCFFFLSGCKDIKKISGKEFQKEYELGNMQTVNTIEYLGNKNNKVFLIKRTMSLVFRDKWDEKILYTEINELDDKFRQELEKINKEYNSLNKPKQ